MPRYLALSLPTFAVDRLAREEPFVLLVRESHGSQWVSAASPAALGLGVRAEMSLAHARALLGNEGGEPAVLPQDPEGDRRALRRLGAWALRFSPRVALAAPDGLLLDLAGNERLLGDEPRQAEAVLHALKEHGLHARAAVAGTIGCAWALARFGPPGTARRVLPAAERQALAPLPIECLRLEEDTVDALRELGIETVAHLDELERDSLPARFGPDLLLRLDQAQGRAFEPFVPLRPPPPIEAARELEAPVGLEAVLHLLRELLRELTGVLDERVEGASRIEVELTCSEAPPVREALLLSRPSRDFGHLWSLLAPRLEHAPLGFGAERVALAMPVTAPLPPRQGASWDGRTARLDRSLGELLDTLAGRLGHEHVRTVEAVESHLPERAFRTRALLDDAPAETPAESVTAEGERPSRLFPSPEPIAVEEREGRPSELRWRGTTRRIVHSFGPERLEAPWWSGPAGRSARDYFRVEDEGGCWLWLTRTADGRWFLHGEWA
ncbi:MAG: DNA polymerase Y family protein [Planctomycetota bacterium]